MGTSSSKAFFRSSRTSSARERARCTRAGRRTYGSQRASEPHRGAAIPAPSSPRSCGARHATSSSAGSKREEGELAVDRRDPALRQLPPSGQAGSRGPRDRLGNARAATSRPSARGRREDPRGPHRRRVARWRHEPVARVPGFLLRERSAPAVVDNPLVALDAHAAARGRKASRPTTRRTASALSGRAPSPFAFPARVVGSLVYGVRLQDQTLPAAHAEPRDREPGPALPQGDLDGRVNTLLANLRVNLDPVPTWTSTCAIGSIATTTTATSSSSRSMSPTTERWLQLLDAASPTTTRSRKRASTRLRPDERLTGHLGYFWEYWHRSDDRQVEDLHEHGPTAKLDYRWSAATSAHASYSFRTREGSGYDPFAYFDETLDAQGRADARASASSRAAEVRPGGSRHASPRRTGADLQRRAPGAHVLERAPLADYRNTDFGLTEQWTWNSGGEAYYQAASPRRRAQPSTTSSPSRYEQESRWRPRSFFVPPPGRSGDRRPAQRLVESNPQPLPHDRRPTRHRVVPERWTSRWATSSTTGASARRRRARQASSQPPRRRREVMGATPRSSRRSRSGFTPGRRG